MNAAEKTFITDVWNYYEAYGRHDLPWRKRKKSLSADRQAYHILVSELMLQQTQVERVIPKYKSFLKRFPTMRALSEASLGSVLREWQGLGYNRRAKMIHECARMLVRERKGKFPKTYGELIGLPGIGNYTAGAIMAFAFNEAVPIVETNIRTVIIHHFFKDVMDVLDTEVLTIVERTLDRKNPREWYYALMDYGTHLKRTIGNANSRSKHYKAQSAFKGSDRQIRGAILRFLSEDSFTRKGLQRALPFDMERIDAQIERLEEEGLITHTRNTYQLP